VAGGDAGARRAARRAHIGWLRLDPLGFVVFRQQRLGVGEEETLEFAGLLVSGRRAAQERRQVADDLLAAHELASRRIMLIEAGPCWARVRGRRTATTTHRRSASTTWGSAPRRGHEARSRDIDPAHAVRRAGDLQVRFRFRRRAGRTARERRGS
jgi:hypothetical protein